MLSHVGNGSRYHSLTYWMYRHVDNLQINSSVVTIVGSQCESNYEHGKYCVSVYRYGRGEGGGGGGGGGWGGGGG